MLRAKQVASYFIGKANAMGNGNKELNGNNDLTNLKLQKILYFAQVEHLQQHHSRLFQEEIQAWQYGPVVQEVYEWLKQCGAYVITEFDVVLERTDTLGKNVTEFLDKIWNKYQKYSAWGLVEETHKKGSAWDQVYRNGLGEREVIGVELLKKAHTIAS